MGRPGRRDVTHSRYRRIRREMLAETDICGLCGHGGARTADHIICARDWPRDLYTGEKLPGFDDRENLQPAHGTMGPVLPPNPCPTCGRLCNQTKGDRAFSPVRPQTRDW